MAKHTEGPAPQAAVRQPSLALGALAVGAGLTMAHGANAALIISDIDVTADGGSFSLDLLGDPEAELTIYANAMFADVTNKGGITTGLSRQNPPQFPAYQSFLSVGDQVDESWFDGTQGFAEGFGSSLFYTQEDQGPWGALGAHGFIALKFSLEEATHFGWLEITRGSIEVGRFGFQDEAGVAAQIPEPATLFMLASGAAGLLGARRRQRAQRVSN